MHHHRIEAGAQPLAYHRGNVVPVGRRGDAGAAELEDDPRLGVVSHGNDREVSLGAGRLAATWTQSRDLERLVFLENVFQLFFELPFGEDILDPAPRCLAALGSGRCLGPTLRTFYEGIEVMRLFGFAEKLIIDIEMFVFAFAHCSRKTLEINGIDLPDT
jgi:hypothetical protein